MNNKHNRAQITVEGSLIHLSGFSNIKEYITFLFTASGHAILPDKNIEDSYNKITVPATESCTIQDPWIAEYLRINNLTDVKYTWIGDRYMDLASPKQEMVTPSLAFYKLYIKGELKRKYLDNK